MSVPEIIGETNWREKVKNPHLSVRRGRNLRERYSQGKDAPRSTCRRYTGPGNVTKTPKGGAGLTLERAKKAIRQKEAVHEQQQQLRRDGSAKDPIVVHG